MPKKLKIAVTGGIGTGKSSVCKIFQSHGYPVLYADQISKDILSTDKIIQQKIIEEFGSKSFIDGEPNTKFLSEKVFSDSQKVKKINSILHPAVINVINKKMDEGLTKSNIVFVEAALIFEANMEDLFDYVLVVSASEQVKIERVVNSRKMNEEEVKKIINNQIPDDKKKSAADFVIENNGTESDLEKKVNFILMVIKSLKQ
ncbi:MAG: dephospho-CoA kinase [Melioribacteraceae bacterium]|nr:dephospho-CoA kinase [Melioribacteraceae bacterium]WKZ71153.1 MAG: dephospho-CoA kinase [Melioribacteraceae bacterium]